MTYEQLLERCRRTLDLHPESKVSLRDMAKIMARNYSHPHTVAALYACLWTNVVEYVEFQRDTEPQQQPQEKP